MMVGMLVAGIGLVLAGLLAIGYGFPDKEFSFGNTLILTGMLTCMRAPTLHIKAHMNAAVKVGATSDEIIEVVELCGQWGGSLAMADGLSAWRLQFAPHLPDIFDKVKTKKYHK